MHWHIGISLSLCYIAFSDRKVICAYNAMYMCVYIWYSLKNKETATCWTRLWTAIWRKSEDGILMCYHDVIKWKHFARYWPFVRGIQRHRWIPRTKITDAELWCFLWSDDWVNNGAAGDLRRYRAHFDVSVMVIIVSAATKQSNFISIGRICRIAFGQAKWVTSI